MAAPDANLYLALFSLLATPPAVKEVQKDPVEDSPV